MPPDTERMPTENPARRCPLDQQLNTAFRHLRITSRTAYGSRSSQIRNCSPDAFLLRCPPPMKPPAAHERAGYRPGLFY